MNKKVQKMVVAGLLIALAIIIPVQFGFLKIVIPPFFTATLAAHVPVMLAMLISPKVALIVGLGSAIGFTFAGLPLYVAARALMHGPVGYIGGKIVEKDKSFTKAILITAPIHAILEALIVIPFGFEFYEVLVVVAIGTIIHHLIDGTITFVLSKCTARTRKKDIYTAFN